MGKRKELYNIDMKDDGKVFAAIDLKAFYASVECNERGLDPLTTNLVVADESRTEKTICLAISPALKKYGLPGRARLFEVIQKVKQVNAERMRKLKGKYGDVGRGGSRGFTGKSCDSQELEAHPEWELDFLVARPRMKYYLDYSAKIYEVYLQFVAPEDIFAYSVDEVFCDLTHYMKMYKMTPEELVTEMVRMVYEKTGITATAGIGTNMYLAKVAMDIMAKHALPNAHGARIATLNEQKYREELWGHEPITDFWRVGPGIAKRLAQKGLWTMGDVARCSLVDEEVLYRMLGVNAELLIDHSWGWEPATMKAVKNYRPENRSLSAGQVLSCPYDYEKARTIVKEMAEVQALDLMQKGLVTDQLVLHVGYDKVSLEGDGAMVDGDRGLVGGALQDRIEVKRDRYGRKVPKSAHGTLRLTRKTAATSELREGFLKLYDTYVKPGLMIRRLNLAVGNLVEAALAEATRAEGRGLEQMDLFANYEEAEKRAREEEAGRRREMRMQEAVMAIREKYGQNAILRGTNFEEGATGRSRNRQIGGHRA